MIKKDGIRYILTFFLASSLCLSTLAQNKKYFVLTGNLISDIESSTASTISISKSDGTTLNSTISPKGRFRLELNYNTLYTLTFQQSGFTPKSVVVNTAVPMEVLNQQANLPIFLMKIKLNRDFQTTEKMSETEQIAEVFYRSDIGQFSVRNVAKGTEIADGGRSGIKPQEAAVERTGTQLIKAF
jgi:hypothetical protein